MQGSHRTQKLNFATAPPAPTPLAGSTRIQAEPQHSEPRPPLQQRAPLPPPPSTSENHSAPSWEFQMTSLQQKRPQVKPVLLLVRTLKAIYPRSYLVEPTSCKLLTVGHPLLVPPYDLFLQLQHPVPLGDPQLGHLGAVGRHTSSPVVHGDSLAGTRQNTAPANCGNVNEHKYFLK